MEHKVCSLRNNDDEIVTHHLFLICTCGAKAVITTISRDTGEVLEHIIPPGWKKDNLSIYGYAHASVGVHIVGFDKEN